MTNGLTVRNLNKYYGDFKALDDINFEISEGQFVTLLGPSGCGKTTLLRIIAGFMGSDSGEIYFGDTLMNDVPPEQRDTAMCFQSYALFPNKTVYENIRFGLRMRKVPKDEQRRRVEEAMEMVNLSALGDRKPYELSGGQQQRVSLVVSFESMPQDILDAAANLGAGPWVRLKEVYIPMLIPSVVSGSIFAFINSMEEFTLSFIIGLPAIKTIPTVLFTYLGESFSQPRASVVALILMIPNLILLMIVERCIKTEYMGAALGKM